MVRSGALFGIKLKDSNKNDSCVGYIPGKSHRPLIPKTRDTRSTKLLELFHMPITNGNTNLCIQIQNWKGFFVSFIDDFSKQTTVSTLENKSKVPEYFKSYKSLAEKHTCRSLSDLHVHECHYKNNTPEKDHPLLKALRSGNGRGIILPIPSISSPQKVFNICSTYPKRLSKMVLLN